MIKYSNQFNRDFKWFLKNRHRFNFCGKPLPAIPFDKNGASSKECFYLFDTKGQLVATKHPLTAARLLLIKASVNFEIKMKAETIKDGTVAPFEVHEYLSLINAPTWVYKAVAKQVGPNVRLESLSNVSKYVKKS